MNIGYHSDFMDRIIERANKRNERTEKMINKMLDKSEPILNAGKPKPQTNEEWFCTLSTEEKAKFIFWQHFDVYGKTLYELMVNASKGVSRDKQAEVMIGAVVEWLKQPHKGGES